MSANIFSRTTNSSGIGIDDPTGDDGNGKLNWGVCATTPPTGTFSPCISLNTSQVPGANFEQFRLDFYKGTLPVGTGDWFEGGTGPQAWVPKLLVSDAIPSPTGLGIRNVAGGEWCANDCNGSGNRVEITGVTAGGVVPSPFSLPALAPLALITKLRKRYSQTHSTNK